MRNLLIVVATAFAAACSGDENTVLATPEIKTGTGQAEAALRSATIATQAGIGFYSVGIEAVDAVRRNRIIAVGAFGLPGTPAIAAGSASFSVLSRETTASSTAPVTGCILWDPLSPAARLEPAGVGTCTAADHLEIFFRSDERASITWSETSATFDLRLRVTAGRWTGTDLRYQGSRSGTSTTGVASVATTGVLKYLDVATAVQADADFGIKFDTSVSNTPFVSATVNMKVSGTVNEHIARVRTRQDWTFAFQQTAQVGATLPRKTQDWNGGVGVDLLKTDGATVDHSLAFNMNLHELAELFTSDNGTPHFVTSAGFGGDIRWEGAVVGNFFPKDNQAYLRWTDGTEGSFDFTSVVGKILRQMN